MKHTILLSLLLMAGCAIPVRPVAVLVPDAHGAHFEPDVQREPSAGDIGAAAGAMLPSPWGTILALGGAAIGGLTTGYATVQRKRAAEHKADSDQAWDALLEQRKPLP